MLGLALLSPGTDLGPLVAQLPGGDCSVPHDRLTTEAGVVLAEFSSAADARQLFQNIAAVMQAAG